MTYEHRINLGQELTGRTCHFKLVVDMVEGGVKEFVNDEDRLQFLQKGDGWDLVWMGTGRSVFATVQVDRCPFIYISRASDLFLKCKKYCIFVRWSWHTRLEDLPLARKVMG